MHARRLHRLIALLGMAVLSPLIAAEGETLAFDSRGIPYSVIDDEPCLGRVAAVNRTYNFLVAPLFRRASLDPGRYVALRRNGVIVCFAYVESVESRSVATLTILQDTTGIHAITNPSVGDEVILIPQYGRGPDSPPDF